MTNKVQTNSRTIRKALLVGTAVGAMAALATPVLAAGEGTSESESQQIFVSQTQNPGDVGFIQPDDPAGAGSSADDDDDDDTDDRIVVTGSRIARDEFAQTAPVVSIDRGMIETSGLVALSDILQRNPNIAGGLGVGLQNQADGGLGGAGFINQRGLGVDRSLVLVNGKRRVPGEVTSSAADINAIPNALIERVEILTGGTSAVYGADAVVGVTNIILKNDFEGLELSGQAGIPQHGGGGDQQNFNVTGGGNFADGRGNAVVSVSYSHIERLNGADRNFSRGDSIVEARTNFQNTGPNDGIPDTILFKDVVTATFPNTGAFFFFNGNVPFDSTVIETDQSALVATGDPLRFNWFTVDGNGLRPLQNDRAQCFVVGCFADGRTSGGDGFRFEDYITLINNFERITGFGRINYEVHDNIDFYAQFDASHIESFGGNQAPFLPFFGTSLVLTRDNPLLDPSLTAFMDDPNSVIPLTAAQIADPIANPRLSPITSINVNRTFDDLGRRTFFNNRNSMSAIGGFKGEFTEGWDFDVFYQFGRTDVDSRGTNMVRRSRLLQALNVISDPMTGAPVCRDAAARAAGCEPLRGIGPENVIPDGPFRRWLYHEAIATSKIQQELMGGTVTGTLFELPAGDFDVAGGAEFRREQIQFRDDAAREDILLQTFAQPEDGKYSVLEFFGEGVIPIIADKPLFKNLQIEGAVRYSDYNLALGDTFTWKAGGTWAPSEDIRFRVSRSKSVRAPTLTDLFTPGAIAAIFPVDPCNATELLTTTEPNRAANCAALGIPATYQDPQIITKQQETGGNKDLGPETAKSWTIGGVLTPRFIPNLSLAIDYWDIELLGAIATLPLQDLIDGCVDSPTLNNIFCPLVDRFPAGNVNEFQISRVRNTFVNSGALSASGVDFNMRYFSEMADLPLGELPGSFTINVGGTYLDKNNSQPDPLDPDTIFEFAGELGLPHWRLNSSVTYNHGPLSVNWFLNFRSEVNFDNDAETERFSPDVARIPSRTYNDISVIYDVSDTLQLNAGINNVFDVERPIHPAFTFNGGGGNFDVNGRLFLIGARVRL